jgi:hypothetical protein
MTDDRREVSFDELAKGLASGDLTRGKALRLMGAALLGGTLASVPGIAVAASKPRPNGRKCKTNIQCVSSNCQDGVCQAQPCQAGETNCNGQCVDTQADEANCGSCGSPCGAGQSCVNGACVTTCNAGAVGDFCFGSIGCCSGKCRWIYDTSQPCPAGGQCECIA